MKIRVTHAAGRDPNQDFAGFGPRRRDVFYNQRCIDVRKNDGAHIAQFSD